VPAAAYSSATAAHKKAARRGAKHGVTAGHLAGSGHADLVIDRVPERTQIRFNDVDDPRTVRILELKMFLSEGWSVPVERVSQDAHYGLPRAPAPAMMFSDKVLGAIPLAHVSDSFHCSTQTARSPRAVQP